MIKDDITLSTAINNRFHDSIKNGVEASFSEIGTTYSGLSGKSSEDFGRGKPFVPYTNVFSNSVVDEEDMGEVRIGENEKQNRVEYGDLLLTLSSETPNEVGVGAVYLGCCKELYLNSFCLGIHIVRKDIVLPTYLPYLVESKMFRRFIFPFAQGSTRYNLQKSDFEHKKITLPKIVEQQRITEMLNSLSEKIVLESTVQARMYECKKALLKILFI